MLDTKNKGLSCMYVIVFVKLGVICHGVYLLTTYLYRE